MDWWSGTKDVLHRLLDGRDARSVRAVGVAGMVPAIVGLDEHGRPVRPSIQQNDARATEEIDWFASRFDEDELFARTGATWNQQLVAPKLRWLRRHESAEWGRAVRVTGSYEFVTGLLGAEPYTESNWALESGMWDVEAGRWLEPVLELTGADEALFGPVRRPFDVVGAVSPAASAETGLAVGTPLIAGSADHIAAVLAAGLEDPGDVVMKLGGAGDFLYVTDAFKPVRELFIDFHDVPDRYVLNGCMASSGSLVKWFKTGFAGDASYADLDAMAEEVGAGADGLVLLPYFLGEKTPIHDPRARGTLVGLTLSHHKAHVHRAILEGVAYAFRHHLETLRTAGYAARQIFVMDGGARSGLWRQILASTLDHPVVHLRSGASGSAMGVALVAGVSAGAWTWRDIPSFVQVEGTTDPDASASRRYARLYAVYRELYHRLKDLYPELLEAAHE